MPTSQSIDALKARRLDAVDEDRFEKHGAGPHPESTFPIEGAIDYEFFMRLAVASDAKDLVQAAFVVAEFARAWFVHGLDGGEVALAAAA